MQLLKIILDAVGEIKLSTPDRPELGDYAFFATEPEQAADKLRANKDLMTVVDRVEVVGQFVNLYLKNDVLLNTLIEIDGEYGKSEMGKGQTVVVDYSAPNIAKPFGIGHLRSTIIGQALYNLYQACGYKTIGDNHLGDWGTQFGKLLYKIQNSKYKSTNQIQNLKIENLEKMYVEFHQEVKEHPELEAEARAWFKKLEDGDPVAKKLWQVCVDVSLAEFQRIYDLLEVKIDYAFGESFYEERMKGIVKLAHEKKLAHESEGAIVIDIPGQKTPLMLLKSDGATTYATRDLATLEFRQEKWQPTVVIYEVGVEQKLHFEQIFATAKLLGIIGKKVVLHHTKHGWYLGPDGKKFSTREGKTIKLEEVLLEAIARAKKLGCKDEDTAKAVGVGAIKYYDLMRSVTTDVVFDWEKVMNLEGNSGPYLQYTYARARSVLAKSEIRNPKSEKVSSFEFSASNLTPEERALLRHLIHYPEIVEEAATRFAPNLLCEYLYQLASKFNTFYNKHKILNSKLETNSNDQNSNVSNFGLSASDLSTQSFRLNLTSAVAQVLQNGLTLLGITAPERM